MVPQAIKRLIEIKHLKVRYWGRGIKKNIFQDIGTNIKDAK